MIQQYIERMQINNERAAANYQRLREVCQHLFGYAPEPKVNDDESGQGPGMFNALNINIHNTSKISAVTTDLVVFLEDQLNIGPTNTISDSEYNSGNAIGAVRPFNSDLATKAAQAVAANRQHGPEKGR